jgi:hypothetical protein
MTDLIDRREGRSHGECSRRSPSGASLANELERLLVPIAMEVSSYWEELLGLRFKNVRRAQQRWAIVSVISVCGPIGRFRDELETCVHCSTSRARSARSSAAEPEEVPLGLRRRLCGRTLVGGRGITVPA